MAGRLQPAQAARPAGRSSPVRPIDRASPTDMVSLASDTGRAPMQVGAAIVLDAGPGLDPARIESLIAERVRTVPRLRQRLARTPFGCGRPVWVDDPEFDITRHVRRVACPPPADEHELLALAATEVTHRLPRSRPLWSAVLVTGLTRGRVGLVVVFHHVLADGIGGLAILGSLLDGMPDAGPAPFPAAQPSRRALAADVWRGRLRAVVRLPRRWASTVPTLRSTVAGIAARRQPAMHSSLNRPTGPRRRLAVARADLARLRSAAHECTGTVNDALLTAVVGALHTLLAARGEQVDSIVVSMPASARASATATSLGNRVGVIPVALPATGAARHRLSRIAAITREAKQSAPDASAAVLDPVFRLLAALRVLNWLIDRQRMVHTFVTNMRGPDRPVALGGATVEAIIPIGATTGNVSVAFAALSYAGTLSVTVLTDPDRIPDLPTLRAALQTELDTLTA